MRRNTGPATVGPVSSPGVAGGLMSQTDQEMTMNAYTVVVEALGSPSESYEVIAVNVDDAKIQGENLFSEEYPGDEITGSVVIEK